MDIKTSSRWKMGYKPRFFEKLNQQDGLTPDNADDGLHKVVTGERGKPDWVQVATSAENLLKS